MFYVAPDSLWEPFYMDMVSLTVFSIITIPFSFVLFSIVQFNNYNHHQVMVSLTLPIEVSGILMVIIIRRIILYNII